MRNTLLLIIGLFLLQFARAQSVDSLAIEKAFQTIISLEQDAYYDSAAQAYRVLRSRLREEKNEDASNRATYKIGFCLIRAGHYAESKDSLLFGIEDMLSKHDSTYLHIVSSFNELGTGSWLSGDLDNAEKYYQISLNLALQDPLRLKDRIRVSSFNMALMNSRRGNYEEAIGTFQSIIARLQQSEMSRSDTLTVAHAWINIGTAYNGLGDFTRSLKYNRLGLEGHRYYYGDNHPQIGNDLTNIGHMLEVMKRYEEALPYHFQALELQRSRLGKNHPVLANTYLNLGATYEGLRQLDSSRYFYQKALDFYEASREPNDYDLLLCLNNLGGLAYQNGDYQLAKAYHQRVIKQAGQDNIEEVYGEALIALGLDYWALGDPVKGREMLDAGLAELKKSSLDGSIGKSIFKPSLLEGFGSFAGAIRTHEKATAANLSEILALVDSGQLVLHGARLSDIDGPSRETMRKKGKDLLGIALETTYDLNAIEPDDQLIAKAFRYAENSKAAALYDQLRFVEALEFADVPESFKKLERQLKAKLTLLREDLYYEQAELGREEILELNNEIDRYELRYDSLLAKLAVQYPRYFQLKHGNSIAKPAEIQANLPPATAMLVYTLLEKSVIIWQIGAAQTRMFKLPRTANLTEDIKAFRDAAQNPNSLLGDFTGLSNTLYESILAPALEGLNAEVQSLIIVPDAALNLLPFELLSLRGTPSSFQEIEYLFKRYAISYAYSASVFQEQLNPALSANKSDLFAGFAASYNQSQWAGQADSNMLTALVREGELPLPAARQEVEKIAAMLQGKAFLDEQATEANFKAKTADYAILHLSMHALLDDQNPMYSKLLFSPDPDSTSD
ncbi:MAG: CHAT domain-containing tetratricopeptide repeat protein, partial [Bacteroidota bacterium]